MDIKEIQAISISIDYDEIQSFFVLLTNDGNITRMGNGRNDNDDFNVYFGKIEKENFDEIINNVTEDMLKYTGNYTLKVEGVPCDLLIMLYGKESNVRFRFVYGSQFEGLPGEIYNLVKETLKLTDNWYNEIKPKK